MTSPHYILLTVKKITVPTQRGPAPSQSTMLNPVVRKLFPLPIAISMAQHGREAEVDAGAAMVLTMAEDFNDVLAALESAAAAGKYIVRPMQRGAIEEAVFPIGERSLEQGIEDATTIVQAVNDEAEDFQGRVKEAVRAVEESADGYTCIECGAGAHDQHHDLCKFYGDGPSPRNIEGAKHQGELARKIAAELQNGRAGPPTPRAPKAGDLRIATDGDRHWIEVCSRDTADDQGDKPIFEWTRFGVPPELLPMYSSKDAARQAVKLAGYVRRLVEA
jgi:hypothetical protein